MNNIFQKIKKRTRKITLNYQKKLIPALADELIGAIMKSHFLRVITSSIIPHRARTPKKMVFLCGCYNSGTTIMRDILGGHEEIQAMPREGVVYTRKLTSYTDKFWTRFWPSRLEIDKINEIDFSNIIKEDLLNDWWIWIRNDKIFVEKSITNSARMIYLQDLFPDAKFIIMRRDCNSVAEGIIRRTRCINSENTIDKPSFADAINQWRLVNTIIDGQLGELNSVLEIQYEDLTSNPKNTMNVVFDFLGVSAEIRSMKNGMEVNGIYWEIIDGNQRSKDNLSALAALSED